MSLHWITDSPHTRRIANGSTYKSATRLKLRFERGLGSRLFIYGTLSWCPTRRGYVLEQKKYLILIMKGTKVFQCKNDINTSFYCYNNNNNYHYYDSCWKKWEMDERRLDSKTSLKRKIVPTADFEAEALERVFVFAENVGCQLSDCFGCCIGRCLVTPS